MLGERGLRRAGMGSVLLVGAAVAMSGGCQSPNRRTTMAEPGLSPTPETATAPTRTVTWVDRHPLFYKPRDYYESSGDKPVIKAAAATVIGIPAGIFGELKQIVVGAPTDVKY